MEPKRFVITDCLSNGDAIAAHMTQSEVGTWVSYDDPEIAAYRAIAKAAREAAMKASKAESAARSAAEAAAKGERHVQ